MGVLEDLLRRGYLPIQLPPGFSSSTFLDGLRLLWPGGAPPRTVPEKYSVARSSYYRRTTALVNPISFYFLASDIATHWPQIEAHYKKSQLSRSIPKVENPGSLRAIDLPRFGALHEDKIIASSGFKYALVTDITSYFPAIYTHSIPWALHTKAVAKVNQGKSKSSPAYLGNLLDHRCMDLQDRQTIGLPIGPDTSHILAEIIGVAIDERLNTDLGAWPTGFRYVDDFFLFFGRREDAEKALASISKAVSEFELHINPAKTRIIEVKELVDESWKYSVKKLSVAAVRRQQRDDIHHFFEALFSLEKRFRDESLVKYGLKRLSTTIVKRSNWSILEAYLLKCGYSFPNTLQVIARIFTTYAALGYPLNKDAIGRFCNELIRSSAVSNHHGEVSWLLWICKELELSLAAGVVKEVFRMPGSVCKLLALDLHQSGLASEAPDASILHSVANEKALTGTEWLLSYEGGRRKWLHNSDTAFIEKHPYFGPMLTVGVHFYSEKARLGPLFRFSDPSRPVGGFDFDTDAEIDKSFDFEDLEEEYSDSAKTGESEDTEESDEDEDEDIEF
jgi:hypothetical protein